MSQSRVKCLTKQNGLMMLDLVTLMCLFKRLMWARTKRLRKESPRIAKRKKMTLEHSMNQNKLLRISKRRRKQMTLEPLMNQSRPLKISKRRKRTTLVTLKRTLETLRKKLSSLLLLL